ncbi:MAG: flagellar export chaperone FliS [Bacillota bacterium]|nr:flagellar export chaperone FliS [Bacillota bacterium]
MINKGFEQYKESSIMTASPEELTLMLYNGFIKFLMQAQMAIDEKNIEKAHNNLVKAENILVEFQATLDPKYEISNNLYLLYDYMYRRLTEAVLKKDKAIIEEVLGFARELRDTWSQAMKAAKQQTVRLQQIAK